MNPFLELALRTFCSNEEVFGESSTYIRFEEEPVKKGKPQTEGLNSQIKYGHVVYQHSAIDQRISPAIALKLKTPNPFLEDFVTAQFFNEITFHSRALPLLQQQGDVQPLLAKFYDSFTRSSAGNIEFVLIFENLQHQGFRTHPRYSFLDVDHLLLMLNTLGRFHSYSYRAKSENPIQFQALGRWFHDAQCELMHCWPNFMRYYGRRGVDYLLNDPRYRGRLANVEKYLEDPAEFMRQRNIEECDLPVSVLCHGDYLRGNVMFRYENGQPVELKMIDLATARIASPVIDLCGVLYVNADQETRSRHWDRLMDAYYEGLIRDFGADAVPSRESILNEFKVKAFYAYIIASYFLPRVIGLDLGKPDFYELLPEEYASCPEKEIPEDLYKMVCETWGGAESTVAVANILKDMIDRGFV